MHCKVINVIVLACCVGIAFSHIWKKLRVVLSMLMTDNSATLIIIWLLNSN